MRGRRIVIATVGSLGDLHPFIAVALALQRLGARPLLAVPQDHVAKCVAAGLETEAILPAFSELGRRTGLSDEVVVRRVIEDIGFLVQKILLPPLAESTERLLKVSKDADTIVGSLFSFAAPIAAERLSIPLVAAILQPMSWFSSLEPPVAPGFGLFRQPPYGSLGIHWNQALSSLLRWETRRRFSPAIEKVRRENNLPPSAATPMFEPCGKPALSLGLYSAVLGALPPDAPLPAEVTGFPWFDSESGGNEGLDPALRHFLLSGPAPLVFTLGSFVPLAAAAFYRKSAQIARELGMRAVLLTGENSLAETDTIMVRPYAPHSQLFPRAAAIIHHGGVGTTGQALRSGKPQLVVPFMGDQFDQASRIERIGVGLAVSATSLERELKTKIERLVREEHFASAAATAAEAMAREDGATAAASAILRIAA